MKRICTKCGSDGPFGKHLKWCLACLASAAKARRKASPHAQRYDLMPKRSDGSICIRCEQPGEYDRGRRVCKACRAADRKKTRTPENTKLIHDRQMAKRPGLRLQYQATRNAKPTIKEDRHKYKLKENYGLTKAEYDRMLTDQEGLCAICYQPETRKLKGVVKRLAVDHDHVTGKIRALLCSNCNAGIGLLKDSITLLEAAVVYLKRHAS